MLGDDPAPRAGQRAGPNCPQPRAIAAARRLELVGV